MVTEKISLPQFSNWQSIFTPQSSLNPKFFAYGSLPIYLLKIFSWFLSVFLGNQWLSYSHLPFSGRFLIILFDLGSIFVIFKIGDRVWGRKIGLLGAFFYSSCVLPIQLSHFFAVDIPLNFFILVTLYRLLVFYDQPNWKNAPMVGLVFGLSLATKVSASLLIFSVGMTLLVDLVLLVFKFIRETTMSWWIKIKLLFFKSLKKIFWQRYILKVIAYFLIIVITTGIVYFFTELYTLVDFKTFWRQINEQHKMTYDPYIFPYTLQYVGTIPYLYQLKNMIFWGMGISLGIFSILGTLWYLIDLGKRLKAKGDYDREAKELILIVFWVIYFLIVGKFAVKFMRYFLPLYPIFILMAVKFLIMIFNRFKKGHNLLFLILLIIFHLIWLLAFLGIYFRPHSRVKASEWINKNIPPGAVLAVEHWDDRLPLWGGEKYNFVEMPMYQPDNSNLKWQKVSDNLRNADYIIIASNRLYVPLQKLSDCSKYRVCFPQTAKYYHDLFSGKLGFRKIAEFTSYPGLKIGHWKLEIKDDAADESFTVYDHPKVIIFQKQAR